MFKKSLLAVALITASTGAFAQADLKTATELAALEVSIEGSASKSEILAGDLTVKLGAEYTVGDVMVFSFVGGDVDTATAPTSYTSNGADPGSVTVGLLSSGDTSLTYRVTEIVSGASTVDELIVIAALEFDTASVLAGTGVVATYAASTDSGITIDAGSKSVATIITTSNQFAVDRSADDDFNAIIDVEAGRLAFAPVATTDAAEYTITSDGSLTYPATALDTDLVLTGSFDFLDEDLDTAGIQTSVGTILPAATTVTSTEITWEAQSQAATTTHGITLDISNLPADTIISTQDFTISSVVNFTDHGTAEAAGTAAKAGSTTFSATDVGTWELNGAAESIAFLPFGAAFAQSITVSNTGTIAGDITVELTANGVTYTKTLATESAANSVTNISLEVKALAVESGITGNAHIQVIVNVPADAVSVKGIYYHKPTADRVLVGK
jgi:hypothetical protein